MIRLVTSKFPVKAKALERRAIPKHLGWRRWARLIPVERGKS